jgi:aryl-alcohol dehydrogenase-like predicted oxidoreductase
VAREGQRRPIPRKATPAQIALAWILARKSWTVPIPGTTQVERLDENLAAANVELTKEDVLEIEEASSRITFQGDRYNAASQATIDR